MPEHEQKVDGFLSLIAGMHGGREPDLLPEQQYARGINVSVRGGLIHTRPALRQIFSVTIDPGATDTQFRGAATYYDPVAGDSIVFCFGLHLFMYNLKTGTITSFEDVIDSESTRLYFCQAHKYMVIQDDVVGATYEDKSWPIVLEGTSIISDAFAADRDATPENQLPKGQMMAYGHGRLFVSVDWLWTANLTPPPDYEVGLQNRSQFIAGDIFQAWNPSNILQFSENLGSGGGAINLPSELGLITGMGFQRNVQTGTGHGPLVVWSDRGAATFSVDLPRELSDPGEADWQNAGLGKILFQTVGLNADMSIASVNNDLIYRAGDGVRTLRYTASEAQGSGLDLSVDDISEEVKPWNVDSVVAQKYASGAFANNRYLMTTNAATDDQPFSFQGLISLDTSVTGGFHGRQAQPVYDGIWTGLNFNQVVSARNPAGATVHYILGNGASQVPGIWSLEEGVNDLEQFMSEIRPLCRIHTRTYFFGSAFSTKELQFIQVMLRGVEGTVDLTAYYRTDGAWLWKQMGAAQVVEEGIGGRTHMLRIPVSDTECDSTGAPLFLHVGNGFQFAIEWTGIAKVGMAEFRLKNLDRAEYVMCETMNLETVESASQFSLGDFDYKI